MARLDNGQAWLFDAMRATGKPLLVSSYYGEPVHSDAALHLFCPPGYPAVVTDLPHRFTARPFLDGPAWLGLSSHCLAPELPIAAVARGCKLIEMHTMLDDEPSELEANVSLSISAFRDMVQAVRRTEAMLA
jgi:sialic acid synthase SpsE